MQQALEELLSSLGSSAVAVSGGVDSMTLSVLANRVLGPNQVTMMHAISPAVPPEATARVRHWAKLEGWELQVLDAGEFADSNYLANPVNRCFFCKSNLYGAIGGLTDRQILSGANTDDLGEYRPGLDAARERLVRHPYLETGINKKTVRAIAAGLGLGELADLPASPCLSSRVETRIAIDPEVLRAIHAVEILVGRHLTPRTVRCRIRQGGIVIELDGDSLHKAGEEERRALSQSVQALLPPSLAGKTIRFEAYRNGSAFIGATP